MSFVVYTLEIVLTAGFIIWIVRAREHKGRILLILFLLCLATSIVGSTLSCPENGVFKNIVWSLMNSLSMYTGGGAGAFPTGTPLVSAQVLDYLNIGYQFLRLATIASAAVVVVASVSGNLWDRVRNACRFRPYDTVVLVSFKGVAPDVADNFVAGIDADGLKERNMLVAVGEPEHYKRSGAGQANANLVFELAPGKRKACKAQSAVVTVQVDRSGVELRTMEPDQYRAMKERQGHGWQHRADDGNAPGQPVAQDVVRYDFDTLAARGYVSSILIPRVRDAVKSSAPVPRRFMVIGELGGLGGELVRRIVMNAQQPDGTRPDITVVASDLEARGGAFDHRYPMLGSYATLRYWECGPGTGDFYDRLDGSTGEFDEVVVAGPDGLGNVATANDLTLYLRAKGSATHVSVYCPQDSPQLLAGEEETPFGSRRHALALKPLLDGVVDDLAKRVNNFYCGGEADVDEHGNPVTPAQKRATMVVNWRACTQFNKDSSRAMADFLPVEAAWATVMASSGNHDESLARLEHLRWCAFHAACGFRTMTPARMEERFGQGMDGKAFAVQEHGSPQPIDPENPEQLGAYARCDSFDYADTRLEHICLVPWEELPQVDAAYGALQALWQARHPGAGDGPRTRKFREADSDVLRTVRYYETLEQEKLEQEKKGK